MKISRRMFFGTAAAAPLAAKQAAAEAVRTAQLGGIPPPVLGYSGKQSSARPDPYDAASEQLQACFEHGTLPAWKLAEMRFHARARATVLDDDLLAMRSWSGTAKRRAQVERELQLMIDEENARRASNRGFQSWIDKFRQQFFPLGIGTADCAMAEKPPRRIG